MATTYLHAVASLDGFIADERDDVGPLHDWYFNGDHPLADEDHADVHGAPFQVSAASADYVRGMWSRQKVLVIGRHQFDLTNGWEGHPPASDHVVVVFDADGKKVAVATGSAVILPGRPATVTTELTLPDPAGSEDDEEHP